MTLGAKGQADIKLKIFVVNTLTQMKKPISLGSFMGGYLNLRVVIISLFLLQSLQQLVGIGDTNESSFPKAIDLGGGCYDFGGVLIDRKKTTISFDAKCNQTSGLVEYALVHQGGKIHESLFQTHIPPRWIHACLLLLKAKPYLDFFDANITLESKKEVIETQGCKLDILVIWDHEGESKTLDVASMVYNQISARTLDARPFIFTGSRTFHGVYMAERDGSILAIYHDINAVINSVDIESESDDSWVAIHSSMPPLDQKVRFQIKVRPQFSKI